MLDLSGEKKQSEIGDELRTLVRKYPILKNTAYKTLRSNSNLFFLTLEMKAQELQETSKEELNRELDTLKNRHLVSNRLKT